MVVAHGGEQTVLSCRQVLQVQIWQIINEHWQIMDNKAKSSNGSDSDEINLFTEIESCYRLKHKKDDDGETSDIESEPEEFHDCDNCDDSEAYDSSSDCFQYKDAYIDDRDLESLEYDFEPGIHLSSLEFSRIIEKGHCPGCRCNQEVQLGHCLSCSCHQESGHLEIIAKTCRINLDVENNFLFILLQVCLGLTFTLIQRISMIL